MLIPDFTSAFERDVKKMKRQHRDFEPMKEVVRLIVQNDSDSVAELKRRHNMHALSGKWAGSNECHVCNAGDWLLIWRVAGDLAIMQRTGTHDDLFR